MMAVLGATTKVASHDELRAYVDRFNRIAAGKLVPQDELTASRPPLEAERIAAIRRPHPLPSPGRVCSSILRLSPTRSLMLTEAAAISSPPLPSAESLTVAARERTGTNPRPEPR